MLVCRRIWRVCMEFIWSFGAFSSQFAVGLISYARTTVTHGYFIAITFAGSLGRYLNTRPSGLVFKQLPRDPANVNAWKTMDDPYIGDVETALLWRWIIVETTLFQCCVPAITKTCLYNFDPLKPHFYVVKLGFTVVYIIFLVSVQKHRLWVRVRTASPRRF